ncbi:hypothetical protein ACIQ9R_37495 [Streptomyces sp. NPDC094447]|uniref:hypothetical protein n=1 Tax=Streptomyces sp. NPDC094447 TaxID=3366062 RepID=UPI00380D63A7
MMDTPTYQPAPEPDYTPRYRPADEPPVTAADCLADYAAAKRIRDTMDKQDAR